MARLSFWLKDGTRASWTPDAWEFTNSRTGDLRRCLHAHGRSANAYVREFETDHAVFGVIQLPQTEELARWRVWRSAPELAEAQGFDVVVEDPLAGQGSWVERLSRDGRWLLFTDNRLHRIWLHSLADGSGYRLDGLDVSSPGQALFTPDSTLLVVVGRGEVRTWNLAEKRWQTTVSLSMCSVEPSSIVAAVSPARPWRAALRWWGDRPLHVANLEDGSVREILPRETLPRSFRQPHEVSWLGNDRLLVEQRAPDYQLWVVDADGMNPRQVLP